MIDDATTEILPAVVDPGEADDLWPIRGLAKGIRLRLPLAGLLAAALVAAGFWGGAAVEKGHASSSAAAGLAARFRAGGGAAAGGAGGGFRAPGGGAAGFGGGTGTTTAAAATGTLSVVDGKTLYVLTSTGSLLKVTLGQSTTVTRNAKASADELRPGDTVVVQGSTGTGGNVTATSVAATGPGAASN